MMLKHPEIKWYWYNVAANPNITKRDLDKYDEYLSYNDFLNNPNITKKMMVTLISRKRTDRHDISKNSKLTIEMLLKYTKYRWDWGKVSKNPSINILDIFKHPQLPWDTKMVSGNSTLTIDILLNHPKYN